MVYTKRIHLDSFMRQDDWSNTHKRHLYAFILFKPRRYITVAFSTTLKSFHLANDFLFVLLGYFYAIDYFIAKASFTVSE